MGISNKLCINIGKKGVEGLRLGDTICTTNYVLAVSFKQGRATRERVKRKIKRKDLGKRRNGQIVAKESKN